MRRKPAGEVVHALAIIEVSVYSAPTPVFQPALPQLVPAHFAPILPAVEESGPMPHQTAAAAPALYPNWQRKLEHIFSNLEIWSTTELRARIDDTEDEIALRLNELRVAGELDRREVGLLRRGIDQLRQLRIARRMPV